MYYLCYSRFDRLSFKFTGDSFGNALPKTSRGWNSTRIGSIGTRALFNDCRHTRFMIFQSIDGHDALVPTTNYCHAKRRDSSAITDACRTETFPLVLEDNRQCPLS